MRLYARSAAVALPIAWGWQGFFILVRLLWWAFWLGFAALAVAWLGLYFYLGPNIDQYKGRMELQASRHLGLQVRMDSVQASDDFFPQLTIRGLRVYDKQGRVALALPLVL